MRIYIQCAFNEFSHRRGRTAANIAGCAIAVSFVVSLLVWLNIARDSTDEVLKDVGAHFVGYIPQETRPVEPVAKYPMEGFMAAGGPSNLFPTEMVKEIDRLPTVSDASPYLSFRIRSEREIFTIGGFDPARLVSVGSTTCGPADVEDGRFLEPEDRGKVMLESDYAATRGLNVGEDIPLGDHDLEIIATITPHVRPARADIYMHIADARRIISGRVHPGSFPPDSVNMVLVQATGSRTLDAAMRGMGAINTDFRPFGYACWLPAATALGMEEKSVRFLLVAVLVGLFLFIGKTQLTSVVEREHDIGILRVIGWSKQNIILQIIVETVIFSLSGSLLGFIIAGLVVYFVPLQAVIDIPMPGGVVISPFQFLVVMLISLAGGALAGIFPAVMAARRNPAETLRRL